MKLTPGVTQWAPLSPYICDINLHPICFQMYTDEHERSRVMGYVLGGIAAGVLIGYPLGGVLFDFFGESAPFILISFAIGMLVGKLWV